MNKATILQVTVLLINVLVAVLTKSHDPPSGVPFVQLYAWRSWLTDQVPRTLNV